MSAQTTHPNASSRYARLMQYLERDPANLMLIADAAGAALDEGNAGDADRLVERYADIAVLPPALINLKGLAALQAGRFEEAADAFAGLLPSSAGDPTLRFNLASAKYMLEAFGEAAQLVDDGVALAAPKAAALKIEALHHLGQLEDALAWGLGISERLPNETSLYGALASVALDAEEFELARDFALRAGPENDDGLSALGHLALNSQDYGAALGYFEKALAIQPKNGRALIGRGMAMVAAGNAADATKDLVAGAEVFGNDVGAWLGVGWAYFVSGDYAQARSVFARALEIEREFAETHGSLAILDIVENDRSTAERRVEAALLLDPTCHTATIAQALLLSADGDPAAQAAVKRFLNGAPAWATKGRV